MDEMNQHTTEQPAAPSKRGVIVALVALAVVIVAGVIAYNALVASRADTGQASPAAAGRADASATQVTSSGGDALMLADYDSVVYTQEGDARALTALADGKPLVINFWATWCPYCIDEMGDFQAIFDDYEGKVSFAFVDCADGKRETVDDAARWLLEHEYTLPAYYDTTGDAMRAFVSTGLPTTVVVSASGEILTISPGRISPSLMRSSLDSLLEG